MWSSEKRFSSKDIRIPDGRFRLVDCDFSLHWRVLVAVCSRIGHSLRELVLTRNILPENDTFDVVVERCPNIEKLDITGCFRLSDFRFNQMQSLKQLNFACYYTNRMQQLSVPPWVEVVRTLSMGLDERDIPTEEFVKFLREHPNLIELKVDRSEHNKSYASIMPFDVFAVVAANAPQIRRFGVRGIKLVFDGIAQLASMEELEIDAIGDSALTDEHVVALCDISPQMQSFSYKSNSWLLTRASFDALSELRNLKTLKLYCKFPGERDDDELLRPVIERCGTTLRRLVLVELNLGDSTIDRIAALCPSLQGLRLYHCSRVSPAAIRRFIATITASPSWHLTGNKLNVEAFIRKTNTEGENFKADCVGAKLVPGVTFNLELE